MVKNSHYKEHIMRSISESGGRRRQARDKRKKALPVRKLLELERAQQVLPPSQHQFISKLLKTSKSRRTLPSGSRLIVPSVSNDRKRVSNSSNISNNINNISISTSSGSSSESSSESSSGSSGRPPRRRCEGSGHRRPLRPHRPRRGSRARSAAIRLKRKASSSTSGSASEVEGNGTLSLWHGRRYGNWQPKKSVRIGRMELNGADEYFDG